MSEHDSPGIPETKTQTCLCWFPWYPKDWLTSDSVGRMHDAQVVAYVMLLNRQWLCKDGKLPEDMEILSRYAGHDMTAPDMAEVLARFPVQTCGGRANNRLLAIYEEQHAKHQKRVSAAEKRWKHNAKHDAHSHANAHAMHEHNASGSGSYSSCSEGGIEGGPQDDDNSRPLSDPIPPAALTFTAEFESFFEAYPRKTGKKGAWFAWRKATDRPDLPVLLAAIEAQAKSDQWTADGGRYIPKPETWLEKGQWADEIPAGGKPVGPPVAWKVARDGAANAVWDAQESGGDITRAIRVARDKWGRITYQGRDAISAGVELARNNRRAAL